MGFHIWFECALVRGEPCTRRRRGETRVNLGSSVLEPAGRLLTAGAEETPPLEPCATAGPGGGACEPCGVDCWKVVRELKERTQRIDRRIMAHLACDGSAVQVGRRASSRRARRGAPA